jgi:hypothetical protein
MDSSLRQRWRAGGCEQAEDTAGLDRFGAAVRAELAVQVAHVGLDGARRQGRLAGYLRRRQVDCQVLQHPDLALAGRAERGPRAADLGQLLFRPQPMQPQPRVKPGGQQEPQRPGGARHQQHQLPPRLVRVELVQVVNH